MTDDLKVDWGEAIQMTGKRPEWLEDGIPMRWSAGGNPYLDVKSHECVNWGADYPVSIRLPADHQYYRQPTKPAQPDIGIPMTDEIGKRMEALEGICREVLDLDNAGDFWCLPPELKEKLAAALPSSDDEDVALAKSMAFRAAGDFVTPHAPRRLQRLEHHILVAIRRGRALERDSREG